MTAWRWARSKSVYAAGKGEQVTIIGVDGNSDAVKSIKEGRLNASVAQLPYLVGKQAVENVKKAIAGETVRPTSRCRRWC